MSSLAGTILFVDGRSFAEFPRIDFPGTEFVEISEAATEPVDTGAVESGLVDDVDVVDVVDVIDVVDVVDGADVDPGDPDMADIDTGLIDRIEAELADVERALARLDEGTYGRCEVCDTPLGDAELEAAPAARFCRAHLPLTLA